MILSSDTVSAAFQYEIRLDAVVAADVNGTVRAEGALPIDRALQQMYAGLYFPIPVALEPFLVPRGDAEIRLELHCDWIDMRTAKHWTSGEATAGVVFYIESRRFLIRDSPRPATTYEQKTGGADGVKGA